MLGNLRVWTSSSIRSVFLYHRYSTKTIRRESARWAVNPPKKNFQLVADLKRKLMALRWSISAVTVSFFFLHRFQPDENERDERPQLLSLVV